jgi:hypothetical protein
MLMLSRQFIKNHINAFAITIYVIVLGAFILMKPSFLYKKNGTLREFGVGTRNKTVIPIWLLVIMLSILSYFFVLYYLASPRINI